MKAMDCIDEVRKEILQGGDFNSNLEEQQLDRVLLERIESICFYKGYQHSLCSSDLKALIEGVFNQLRRLDVIEPLMKDPQVTEIMINGYQDIFIERQGVLEQSQAQFDSSERLEDLIQSMVSQVGRAVNEADPIVDARLKDGSRLHVILPPIALNGPLVTIRKFPGKPMTMERLVSLGSITKEAADFLEGLVKARYNLFICGGTGK